MPETMVVNVTESAAQAAREAIEGEGKTCDDTFIRIGVRAGGCSGLSYALAFDTTQREGDLVTSVNGVRFVVDERSKTHLMGTTLDYTSGLEGKGFVFRNPNASGSCGCGESFSV